METTLTSKGQVTIPKAIRERLGVSAGDRLHFVFLDDGSLRVEARRDSALGPLPGLLKDFAPPNPVTLEEMREGIRRRAQEKNSRRTHP